MEYVDLITLCLFKSHTFFLRFFHFIRSHFFVLLFNAKAHLRQIDMSTQIECASEMKQNESKERHFVLKKWLVQYRYIRQTKQM